MIKFCHEMVLLQNHIVSEAAKNRRFRQRMEWSDFEARLSDNQFRRMFRITRECFKVLCTKIASAVGEDEFKSEEYLHMVKSEGTDSIKGRMYIAHERQSGSFICGEIKLAISIRLMAGGSYLDLAALYACGHTYVYEIFHQVNKDWICNDDVI